MMLFLFGLAFAGPGLSVVDASAMGTPTTRPNWDAPQGAILSFDTSSDLASPTNGFARPAVARDVIPGHEAVHAEAYINDGLYGNGASWIGMGPDSWVKIDLGRTVLVDSIRFGRDRMGNFDDRDPGRFQVFVATSDDVYASGNDQNDSQEYVSVFDSDTLGFSGGIEGAQTIRASFTPTSARYLKVQFANDGADIDEVEVVGVVAAVEVNACTANPCGEFATCSDLPGSDATASGRSCVCNANYVSNGSGSCSLGSVLNIKVAADSWSYSTLSSLVSLWASSSNNMVQLKVMTSESLGSEEDIVKKLRLGTVSGAMLSTWGLHQLAADALVLNIPGLVRNHNERDELLAKLGSTLEAALDAKGYVVLLWGEQGAVHLFSSSALNTITSLQQAKFASPGSDSSWKSMLTAWGLKLVLLDAPYVLPGFQTGTVSVAPWTPGVAFSSKSYSKARYMSDLVWATQDQAFIVDKRVWSQMPSSLRASLLGVTQQYGKRLHNGVAEEAAGIASLQAQGVQVTSFTDAATWYAQLEASYATLVRGRLVSASVFDSALQIVRDYRATHVK